MGEWGGEESPPVKHLLRKWKTFESSKSLLLRFPSPSKKISPSIIVLYNCIVLCLKKIMPLFHRWGSTASRLELLRQFTFYH